MFSIIPVEKLSIAVTLALDNMSISVIQLPRKPAAPVTRIFFSLNSS